MKILILILLAPILIRALWVFCATCCIGKVKNEKRALRRRLNYLISEVVTDPTKLLAKMPKGIEEQFQGEWALYSCSMTAKALSNMSILFDGYKELAVEYIDKLTAMVLSPEMRAYDQKRWDEDPLEGIHGTRSHVSYYSHLSWMIGEYKKCGGGSKYDKLYFALCDAMDRRINESPIMNLPTYPNESVYMPDMLLAIVALAECARNFDDRYKATVDKWVLRARHEWIDPQTGLLASTLNHNGKCSTGARGSYSALNCYYLTMVDPAFASEQYQCLKHHLGNPFAIREYLGGCDKLLTFDVDAGPLICNQSPSGTAYAIGCATAEGDWKYRKRLLLTAEVAGHTVTWGNKTHYLLARYALVGEAIAMAMRTSVLPGKKQ